VPPAAATWGWTAPSPAAATSPAAPPPAEPPTAESQWPAPEPARRGDSSRKGGRPSALVTGVVGALVGALVAGGLVVAFDDDPDVQRVPVGSSAQEASARPATVIVEPGDIRSVLDKVQPAVVRIDVGNSEFGGGTGTGFIIDADGIIVTNAHVVSGFRNVTVRLNDGDEVTGKVLGVDARDDLAVVQVERTGLPTVELGDSDELQVGDAVVAIGNALGLSGGSGPTVTTGIVSGLDRIVPIENEILYNAIQTDAAINPGNSGGPLVDATGKVIGINTAIASPESSNNVGFAISISSAKPLIEALRNGETPRVAFLGVQSESVTPSIAEDQNLGVDHGALITDVESDSAAESAGIQEGDVIVEVAGREITHMEDVSRVVRSHRPGDELDVVVVRDGKEQTVSVTLGDRPDGG
jgi:S1-C subfamily serine protease